MFIFEITLTNGNPMEGFETGRPLYSTIDRYILICFGRYKLKSTPLLWVEGVLESTLSLTLFGLVLLKRLKNT
jgi:hypothetical protein